jgi:hypothetical protein
MVTGTAVKGAIGDGYDTDYFRFFAEEGAMYYIEASGGTLTNPTINIYGNDAALVPSASIMTAPEEPSVSGDSSGGLIWTCSETGVYSASVSGADGGAGTYMFSASTYSVIYDHGNSYASATPVEVGSTVIGRGYDYFSFEATAGTTYAIGTKLGVDHFNFLYYSWSDTAITLYDTDGTTELAYNDDYGDHTDEEGVGFHASGIYFTCQTTGTYYVKVSTGEQDFNGVPFFSNKIYKLSITVPIDDHGNDHLNATHISAGNAISAERGHSFDEDYFSFDAAEGESYLIKTKPGTLADPALHLYDTDGVTSLAVNDDRGASYGSEIKWKCLSSGTYYVKVRGYASFDTGTYTLALSTLLRFNDDHGNTPASATAVYVDTLTDGKIEHYSDHDYFSFDAVSGKTYKIGNTIDTRGDYIVELYDTDGTLKLGTTFERRWLGLSFFIPGAETPFDIHWQCRENGTYYLKVRKRNLNSIGAYTLAVSTSSDNDDHGNYYTSATPLAIGSTVDGTIEYTNDRDYFVFNATKDTVYRIECPPGTLFGTDVETVNLDNKIRVRSGLWVCRSAGTYYIKVKAQVASDTGTYSLTVSEVPDDHGNSFDTASEFTLGSTVNGGIDYSIDYDYFTFQAEEGKDYSFYFYTPDLVGKRMMLYDADLRLAADAKNGKPGVLKDHLTFTWKCKKTGTCYVLVLRHSSPPYTGTYDLTIKETSVSDDHGDAYYSTTALPIDATVEGRIESFNDEDWFSFYAVKGERYFIEQPDYAYNSFLTLYDTDGITELDSIARCYSSRGGLFDDPKTLWECPETGRYYLRVYYDVNMASDKISLKLYYGYLHHYKILVSHSTYTDDHGETFNTATPMEVGTYASGKMNYPGDVDYFSFYADEGKMYVLDIPKIIVEEDEPIPEDLYSHDLISNNPFINLIGNGSMVRLIVEDKYSPYKWMCMESGYYFIVVGHYGKDPANLPDDGVYSLSVYEGKDYDDHGDSYDTATPISADTLYSGAMETFYDVDFFSFDATKGDSYYIETPLLPSDKNGLFDIYLYNPSGKMIAYSEFREISNRSKIHWTCENSGTYYIKAKYYIKTKPNYSNGEVHKYSLIVSTDTGTTDDHGDYYANATTIPVNTTVTGDIERLYDVDCFSFYAYAGASYSVGVTTDTLSDFTFALYSPGGLGGTLVPFNGSIPYTFTQDYTGRVYIPLVGAYFELDAYSNWVPVFDSTGTYKITVTSEDDPGYGDPGGGIGDTFGEPEDDSFTVEDGDDQGEDDSFNNPTEVTVGEPISAGIDSPGDIDYYAFNAYQMETYSFEVTLGTLSDTQIIIYDTNGAVLADNKDSSAAAGAMFGIAGNTKVVWTSYEDNMYYVTVGSGDSQSTGTYDFQIVKKDITVGGGDTGGGGGCFIATASYEDGNETTVIEWIINGIREIFAK